MTAAEMLRRLVSDETTIDLRPTLVLNTVQAEALIALCEWVDRQWCGVCGRRLPGHWADCTYAAFEASLKETRP